MGGATAQQTHSSNRSCLVRLKAQAARHLRLYFTQDQGQVLILPEQNPKHFSMVVKDLWADLED